MFLLLEIHKLQGRLRYHIFCCALVLIIYFTRIDVCSERLQRAIRQVSEAAALFYDSFVRIDAEEYVTVCTTCDTVIL